ncbi:unnamed protein product [Merluccius merluccius]
MQPMLSPVTRCRAAAAAAAFLSFAGLKAARGNVLEGVYTTDEALRTAATDSPRGGPSERKDPRVLKERDPISFRTLGSFRSERRRYRKHRHPRRGPAEETLPQGPKSV